MGPRIARAGLRSRIRGWMRRTVAPLHIDQKLYVSNGEWPFKPESFTYQWLRCTGISEGTCSEIAGATGRSYRIQAADEGAYLRCRVTAHHDAVEQSAVSQYVGPVPTTAVGETGAYRYGAATAQTLVVAKPAGGGSGLHCVIELHGGGWTNPEGGGTPPVVGEGVGTHGESLAECEANEHVPNVTHGIWETLRGSNMVVFGTWYSEQNKPPPSNPALPKQIEQVKEAIAWVKAHAASFGGDPTKITILGFSSGAHIALMGAMGYNTEHAETAVKRVAAMSPPVNLSKIEQIEAEFKPGVEGPGPYQEPQFWISGSKLWHSTWWALGGSGEPAREAVLPPMGEPMDANAVLYSPHLHVDAHAPSVKLWNGEKYEYVPYPQSQEMLEALEAKGIPNCSRVLAQKTGTASGHASGFWKFKGVGSTLVETEAVAYLEAA
jgi:acetyl esterase/lipase